MANSLCFWRCGDDTVGHRHYAVVVRENGKLLGRLCPDGTATNRKLYAAILSRSRAEQVAEEINQAGEFSAHAIPF